LNGLEMLWSNALKLARWQHCAGSEECRWNRQDRMWYSHWIQHMISQNVLLKVIFGM
jgi:hypothetical protein